MQVQVSLKIEMAATADLSEMEQQIQEAGQQAMREALKQAIRHQEEHNRWCPHCGEKHCRLEGTVRRAIATTARTCGGAATAFSLSSLFASVVSGQ